MPDLAGLVVIVSQRLLKALFMISVVHQASRVIGAPLSSFVNKHCIHDRRILEDISDPSHTPDKCFLNSCTYRGFYNLLDYYCKQCENASKCRRACFSTAEFTTCYQDHYQSLHSGPHLALQSMRLMSDIVYWVSARSRMETIWRLYAARHRICEDCMRMTTDKRFIRHFTPNELHALALQSLEKCKGDRALVCWQTFYRASRLSNAVVPKS